MHQELVRGVSFLSDQRQMQNEGETRASESGGRKERNGKRVNDLRSIIRPFTCRQREPRWQRYRLNERTQAPSVQFYHITHTTHIHRDTYHRKVVCLPLYVLLCDIEISIQLNVLLLPLSIQVRTCVLFDERQRQRVRATLE